MNSVVINLLDRLFEHFIVIKIFHFQTNTFGAHKASDNYLKLFLDNFDKFMESAQGIFGKFQLNKLDVSVKTPISDDNIQEYLHDVIKLLQQLELSDYTDLLNIRDSMIGDLNQFRYLLTFK